MKLIVRSYKKPNNPTEVETFSATVHLDRPTKKLQIWQEQGVIVIAPDNGYNLIEIRKGLNDGKDS